MASTNIKKEEYLINTPPLRALTVFVLPMIIGSLFQQVYNMVDAIIVGRFVGQDALAAVGASAALTNVFICIAIGAGVGMSVLVARSFGARNYGRMNQVVSTSLLFFGLLSILLGIIGIIFSRTFMSMLRTPEEILDTATVYLRVYFLGFPFLFMYNILSSLFNSIGKSRIPLYFLIISSLLNVLLDLYMVITLQMGVLGAALATLIAQGVCAIASFLVFLRIIRHYEGRFSIFSTEDLREMLRLALPSMFQQSTVSIGMMLVQSVVNNFGTEALAGFSAGARIENITAVFFVSVSNALAPYVSQNYGAGKEDRIPKGFHAALQLDIFFSVVLFAVIALFKTPIIGLFLGESGTAKAYEVGTGYIGWICFFFIFLGSKMCSDGVLKGMGRMNMVMIANLANLAVRVIVAILFAPRFGIFFVWAATPLGWLTNLLISYFGGYRKLGF